MDSDDNTKNVCQRRQSLDTKILSREVAQDPHSVSSDRADALAQKKSLLSLAADDVWKLIKTALTLPTDYYPVWKWIFLIYIVWVIITNLVAYMHRSAMVT